MALDRFILRSTRVLLPEGLVAADVVVDGERIAGVEPVAPGAPAGGVEDLGDLVLMPGLVDVHVHVNEPGRTEWEGFAHATRAAAAGGITTIVDMPLNSDPVTATSPALAAKRAAARERSWVDVGFHAGLVPSNAAQRDVLFELDRDGVLAWKAFLCDSGLADFPPATRDHLAAAMPVLAADGSRLLVHAELAIGSPVVTVTRYRDWESSRPPAWELRAIELLVELCRETRCAVHVVHLSAAEALPMLRSARAEGLPITVETCPHYLHFAAEDIADGDARFKCAPPIRGRENRDALWRALADGTIDLIASDHSPCPPAMKTAPGGNLATAWGGIASIQLTLPIVWTGARARGISIERLGEWLCARPAGLVALEHDRGTIAPAKLASLVAWDPDANFTVDPARLLFRHASTTPYAGECFHGMVERVWLRGREVAHRGEVAGAASGKLLARGRAFGAPSSMAAARSMLERITANERRERLARCCAATAWIDAMLDELAVAPPAASLAGLADQAFDRMRRDDWLEAFRGHPRIGDLDSLRRRFAPTASAADPSHANTAALAASEQAGTREASDRVLRDLAQGNADYEQRFGHLFIVCATGKSADEMLAILRRRIDNDPAVELEIAASEQRKITRLRLGNLVSLA